MKSIRLKGSLFNFDVPKVMGILNITPDSFYDGSKFTSVDKALKQVESMVVAGVDIVDIGAASSRPGAEIISPEQEIARIKDTLLEIKKQFPELPLSIDTFHSQVASYAINKGVDIINDISAFEMDDRMLDVITEAKVPYIMMHMKGVPKSMQVNPQYENVTREILQFFVRKLRILQVKGISDVIIDPGFGFGKSIEDNYRIVRELSTFKMLEKPILVGISRKSMIYKYLQIDADKSLSATSALNLQSLLNGADILRVHDVKEAVQMVKLYKMLHKHNYSSDFDVK
jgi:dihydropteroate synthase